jgi:hypothetical protein
MLDRTYAKITKRIDLSNRQEAKKPRFRRVCVSPIRFGMLNFTLFNSLKSLDKSLSNYSLSHMNIFGINFIRL